MHLLLTGASGLVGGALRASLVHEGHTFNLLKRKAGTSEPLTWDPGKGTIRLDDRPNYDAVIHLAGESIASGRWTAAKKAAIRDSRVLGTRLLSETLARLEMKPKVLVSASAIGYYGNRGQELLDETASLGKGFLAEVCRDWEAATQPAQDAGIRVAQARLGVVLSKQGGALKSMLLPFKLGLGGRVGSGQQAMSWITLDDAVHALQFLVIESHLNGPVNLVAPKVVTNAQFTKALGQALRRPTIFPMPAFAARLAFGELADALLLSSARVTPKKLQGAGFVFQHPELVEALKHVL